MRKNLLVATLIGTCVLGLSACSKGDDSSATDQQPQQSASLNNDQAAPEQAMPTQTADSSAAATTDSSAPAATDSSAPASTDASAPASTDASAPASTDASAPASTDSSAPASN